MRKGRKWLARGVMTATALAVVVGGAVYVAARTTARRLEARRRTTIGDGDGDIQWIESGHRQVLIDMATQDDADRYPAHVSADRESIVDLEEVR